MLKIITLSRLPTITLLALCIIPAHAALLAGAAKRTITPDLEKHAPVYLAGFGHNRRATAIHDELYARCLALKPGKTQVVICGVDSIGLFWEDVQRIRQKVKADVIVASLHDHQAPDTMGLWGATASQSGINETYNSYIVDRTAEAALEAIQHLEPARIALAATHPPELDAFIHDNRPPDVHDAELIILSLTSASGKPIATLVNWANHPETLGSKNTQITADYSATLYTRLEEKLGGTAVFINGAVGGMQSPLGAKIGNTPDNSFEKAGLLGTSVADLAIGAIRDARPVKITDYDFFERMVHIPIANKGFDQAAKLNLYRGRKPASGDNRTLAPVGVLRLRNHRTPVLEIALIPGELYPELSVGGVQRYPGADFPDAPIEPAIKSLMKAPFKMLFGLANDEIGYIIPKAEWDNQAPWLQDAAKRWYGEVNSVGPEAAPIIVSTIQELLGVR